MIQAGNKAPDFRLKDETDNDISLSDFKGKDVKGFKRYMKKVVFK